MRRFEKLLVVVGLMAVMSLSAGLTLMGAFLLVGIPLFFAMTAFVYLLAVYPAILLHRRGCTVALVASLAAATVTFVAFGVPALATWHFQSFEGSVQSHSLRKAEPFTFHEGAAVIDVTDVGDHPSYAGSSQVALWISVPVVIARDSRIQRVFVASKSGIASYTIKYPNCALSETRGSSTLTQPFEHCFDYETVNGPLSSVVLTIVPVRSKNRNDPYFYLVDHFRQFKPWIHRDTFKVHVYGGDEQKSNLVILKNFVRAEIATWPLQFLHTWSQGTPNHLALHRVLSQSWEERTYKLIEELSKKQPT